jgi:hypothetical protein
LELLLTLSFLLSGCGLLFSLIVNRFEMRNGMDGLSWRLLLRVPYLTWLGRLRRLVWTRSRGRPLLQRFITAGSRVQERPLRRSLWMLSCVLRAIGCG